MMCSLIKTILLAVGLVGLLAIAKLAPVFPALQSVLRLLLHPAGLAVLAAAAIWVGWRRYHRTRAPGSQQPTSSSAAAAVAMLLGVTACSRTAANGAVPSAPTTPTTLANQATNQPQDKPSWLPKLIPVPIPFPLPTPIPVADETKEQGLRNQSGEALYVAGLTILARDEATGDLGVACLSIVPAIGGIAYAAKAGTGIVVVGAKPNTDWKARALAMLAEGKGAQATVDSLIDKRETDDGKRLVAVLNTKGDFGHYIGNAVLGKDSDTVIKTSSNCLVMTCLIRPRYPCLDAMQAAFDKSAGLPLPERLLLALDAGWHTKADDPKAKPGAAFEAQPAVAASLLVIRDGGGYDTRSDQLVDLRVDFSREPLPRLQAAYDAWIEGVLGPRLRSTQRLLATESPIYRANLEWLNRLRRGAGIGGRIGER